MACAAASARPTLRTGSGVSSVARSRNAAAAARPPRAWARPAELSRSAATPSSGPDCCLRAVPRAAFRIGLGVGGFGEGAVGAAPFLCGRSAVDRRAHQRMPKRHSLTELDQPRACGRRSDVGADSELVRGPPHQHRIADRFRRGNQQQSPRLGLQWCQLALEDLLDTVRERCRTWRTNPLVSSAGVSHRGNSSNANGLPRVSAPAGRSPAHQRARDESRQAARAHLRAPDR